MPGEFEINMLDQNKFRNIICTASGKKYIKEDSRFIEDLGMDLFDIAELADTVEDKFKIKILDEDVGRFKTVKDLMVYCEKSCRNTHTALKT